MSLPVRLRAVPESGLNEEVAETRDVGVGGLYFLAARPLEAGSDVEFILTLPKEITMAGDVHIRCFGRVLRVDKRNTRRGVAARIERFEYLPIVA